MHGRLLNARKPESGQHVNDLPGFHTTQLPNQIAPARAANRTVADIEADVQIGIRPAQDFILDAHIVVC
jgi:hypothetical protein